MKNHAPDIDRREFKIEDILPVKAVGLECLKESNPEKMAPHRYLYKWFARRPTIASRLALLASVLPKSVSNDELLKLMQIGPKHTDHLDESISKYVERKYATKGERGNKKIDEHFGYATPHESTPSKKELDHFHQILREHWDGDLPTVLDPTAGSGTIPMESYRYGLPTYSNELNPVPWLLNKVVLEYAPSIGSIEPEVRKWAEKIDSYATEQLEEFYPAEKPGQTPSYYFCTYSIECPSCGKRMPLSNRWWFLKKSSTEGHAIQPHPHEDYVEFEHVTLPDDITVDEFDPSEGVVYDAEAECPSCNVVTERDTLIERMSSEDLEFEVAGVYFVDESSGKSGYRAGTAEDKAAINKAREKINSDLRLSTLLSTDRFVGSQDRVAPYGMVQWRDIYSPRQFLSHATYLEAYDAYKDDIVAEYNDKEAEAILVLLSFIATKLVNRNSRLLPIDCRPRGAGAPNSMLGNKNYMIQWHHGETNPTFGSYSYTSMLDQIMEEYEQLVGYYSFDEGEHPPLDVNLGDAADLSYEDNSIQAVVIDPPYGENVQYSELADSLYVWLKEYLESQFPKEMAPTETNKRDEAVENTAIFSDTDVESAGAASRSELAKNFYESKMSDIFSETYRVLEPGGVLTVYFTDKETEAWDSLTMSLINSGYTVTATHTITSEMPHRVAMRESASADSTLLLTCRKPLPGEEQSERSPTLWNDIRERTRQAAREKATELLDSDLNLTKTDTIISAFGPTLRVFTEEYPVVDMHDNEVRPKRALEEARTAVTEVLIERELSEDLDGVDNLTKWYILSWLVYERHNIPYDEARQLGLGVGVQIDDLKRDTKIWGKSKDTLLLKGQDYRVQDFSALEAGEQRRERAYPIDPQETTFQHDIDAVHAALNVLETKGSDYAWNWLSERDLQNRPSFKKSIRTLLQVLPRDHDDYQTLLNLVSGETGALLDISPEALRQPEDNSQPKTTLQDF